MFYIGIGLGVFGILSIISLLLLLKAIRDVLKQMDEIEEQPEENRELKNPVTSRSLEMLLVRINRIYQSRQQERILLLRREKGIRREIENVSHDLRTPLTSIIGYLDLIQDKDTGEEEKREYLEIIGKRARGLKNLIDNFYELSRLEGENYPVTLTTVPLQPLIKEIILSFYREFEERGIQVAVKLEEIERVTVADRLQLSRIIINLIQNATKYSRSFFEIEQVSKDGLCSIYFRNDHKGMKEEEMELIFNRFYTGDTVRSNRSSGLGLTIAKILAEKQKAKIHACLEGDVFVIKLQLNIL